MNTKMRGLLAAGLLSVVVAVPVNATAIVYSASLSGAAESPPNASPGTGTAVVTVDTTANTMHVKVTFSGLLGNTTAAHIHCCVDSPGNVGVATQTPTFGGFPLGVTSGTYDQTFDMTLASSFNAPFIAANGGTPLSAWAVLYSQMALGRTYLNIHTSYRPGGEIRGFLTSVPEPGTLALLSLGLAGLGLSRRRRAS